VQNVQKRVLSFAHWKPLQGKALRANVQKRAKKGLPSAGFGKNKNTWHFLFFAVRWNRGVFKVIIEHLQYIPYISRLSASRKCSKVKNGF
jgi:hypothetical protein